MDVGGKLGNLKQGNMKRGNMSLEIIEPRYIRDIGTLKLQVSTDGVERLVMMKKTGEVCIQTNTPNGHSFDVLVTLDEVRGLVVEFFTGGNLTDTKSWEWSDLDLYSDDQIEEGE